MKRNSFLTRAAMMLLVMMLTTAMAWAQTPIGNIQYNDAGYYEVDEANDLRALATYVNEGGSTTGMTFKQMNDIDFGATDSWETSTMNNFVGIGNNVQKFAGTYDGQGYTITGVRLYNTGYSNSDGFRGLFGQIDEGGTVKNVVITKSRFYSFSQVGAIAGYNAGTIINCYVKNVCVNIGVSSVDATAYGAIVGVNRGELKYNYYYDCRVRDIANATNVGSERSDDTTNDGATRIWTGSGTSYQSYKIYSSSAWELLVDRVAGGETFSGKYFFVGADITVRRAVGTSTYPFKADINGEKWNGIYTITTAIDNSITGQAPFAYISDANIHHFTIKGTVAGGNYSAGLVGYASGTNTIEHVVVNTDITAKATYCGGIVGHLQTSSTTIRDCVFSGSISGGTQVGVICGWGSNGCTPTLERCLEIGSNYTGTNVNPIGLISTWGTVTNCYYLNDTKGSPSQNTTRGKHGYTISKTNNGVTVSGAGITYDGTTYLGDGDVVTLAFSGIVTDGYVVTGYTTTNGTINGTTFTMGAGNATVDISMTDVWGVTDGRDGSEAKPWLITSATGLDLLSNNTREGNYYRDKFFELDADITYDNTVTNNYKPVGGYPGRFDGTFDGHNHTISGIRIDRGYRNKQNTEDYYNGVFGEVGYYGTVKNLHVADMQIRTGGRSGGVAGACFSGKIMNCYVHKDVLIKASESSVTQLGGIVGYCSGSISNCVSSASITSPNSSAPHEFGGIAGCAGSSAKIQNNLSIGSLVSGSNPLGAIIGKNEGSVLANNYYSYDSGARLMSGSYTISHLNIGCNGSDITTNNGAVPLLRDGVSNEAALGLIAAAPEAFRTCDMKLSGRTLQAGGWNTFCAPFEISSAQIESVFGAGVKVRQLSSSSLSNDVLTLNFAEATTIEAGKPYLVKVASTVADPVFNGVSIVDGTATIETAEVNFVPVMNPTELTAGDKSVLFIKGGNTLIYPTATANMNGFRAYFQLLNANNARSFNMNFDDGETTALKLVNSEERTVNSEVYDLQGRKVANPTKGLYIINGKKVVK